MYWVTGSEVNRLYANLAKSWLCLTFPTTVGARSFSFLQTLFLLLWFVCFVFLFFSCFVTFGFPNNSLNGICVFGSFSFISRLSYLIPVDMLVRFREGKHSITLQLNLSLLVGLCHRTVTFISVSQIFLYFLFKSGRLLGTGVG